MNLESCYALGSGLNNGTGLTRWLKNGCCLLMEAPQEDAGVWKTGTGDLLQNFSTEPEIHPAQIILHSGDAGMGIDNRSWIQSL